MRTILTLTACLIFAIGQLFAQNTRFLASGKIQFEKTVNMYAVIISDIDDKNTFDVLGFDAYKKNNPQFKKLQSVLTFGDNKTLFTPAVPEEAPSRKMGDFYADQINTTYIDYVNQSTVIQKEIYGQTLLLKDSVRKITWKITDETRDILGYSCRRANGLVMDSIYAVAFYTERIPVSGGPESFNGLPGMILGLALPHENITWFATKVSDEQIPANIIVPPKKGKVVNRKQVYDTFRDLLKNGGKAAPHQLRIFLL